MVPKTLRPRPFKILLLLTLSAALTAIGAWLVTAGQVNGWLLVVFCGTGVVVFIANLLPNFAYLRLDADGLTFCAMFRAHYYRWADLGPFRVGEVRGKPMVIFTFVPDRHETAGLRWGASPRSGHEGAFVDSYGLKPESLADLLNEYRVANIRDRENLTLGADL